jgi:hypothetical protein
MTDQCSTGYEPLYTLKPIAPDLWIADGGLIRFFGLPLPARMTVIQLGDGSIQVRSPIADQSGLADAVEIVLVYLQCLSLRAVVIFRHIAGSA